MIKSKLTSKAQMTIPQPVRVALKLQEGDEIGFEIDGDRAILKKLSVPRSREDPFGAFIEWDSEEDRVAYGNL